MKPVASLIRPLLTLIVVAVALWAGWMLWRYYMESPWTRDGRVRADIVQIAPDVSGTVVSVPVHDNQSVAKGDVLMIIDPVRYRLALAQAEAGEAEARNEMEQRQREAERRERLSSSAIAAEAREQAQSALRVAEAAYRRAQAELDVARLDLTRTEVRAPVNGHIANLQVDVGDYAAASKPLLAIVDSDSIYVAGYFEETKIPRIHEGDKASIRLMGVGTPLEGHVDSIAPAIVDRETAQGADLLPNVNPTFSWVRLAQRIPVRIAIDDRPEGVRLSAGMTATVVVQPAATE
jgi:RND family efflux transporter MFP subunit